MLVYNLFDGVVILVGGFLVGYGSQKSDENIQIAGSMLIGIMLIRAVIAAVGNL